MTRIKKTLVGLGLAVGLLALPLSAGAGTSNTLSNHRAATQELVERAQYDPLATYMMIEMSDLEQVAGHKNLDQATIKFLEENIWDYEGLAQGAGNTDDMTELERIAGRKNLDQATIKFLEDNLWDYEIIAEPVGEPDPVIRLTEEELQFLEENIWGYYPEAQFQQADDTKIGVYDVDPDMFSEEIFWQDVFDSTATFEGDRDDTYPYPHETPGFRAGELDY